MCESCLPLVEEKCSPVEVGVASEVEDDDVNPFSCVISDSEGSDSEE